MIPAGEDAVSSAAPPTEGKPKPLSESAAPAGSPFRIPESARTLVPVIDTDLPRLRMPTWYRRMCASWSKAVWRGQMTPAEEAMLPAFHRAALDEALAKRSA